MTTKFTLMTVEEFEQFLRSTDFNRVVRIIQNHHTWKPSYEGFTGNNHLALLKGMESYHVTERGFQQIAQNLTSFPDGRIALCRPLEKIPAGIIGANQMGVCIEHLGDFDIGKDVMAAEHRETIIKMNAHLCREFNLIPSTESIVYHHWYDRDTGERTNGSGNTKSCPGSAFFGGNTVHDCQGNFIPLVAQALENILPVMTVNQAIRSGVVNASALNVRRGIGTYKPIVKSLARGILVQVYEERDGWCRVHPSEQHWVYGRYLK